MVQGLLRRQRVTSTLIILPCVLSIITLISALFLPQSTFADLLNRFTGDHESRITDQGVSSPTISHSKDAKAKEPSRGDANNPNADDGNSTALSLVPPVTSNKSTDTWTMVSQKLLDLGVYDETSDFVNEKGIIPTGWEHPNGDPNVWGPCRFIPEHQGPATAASLEWRDRRRRPPSTDNNTTTTTKSPEYYRNADLKDFDYLTKPSGYGVSSSSSSPKSKMGGWCRPGFLIIGAGKCGTSSLYHYMIGHPRILPAIEKQIHYFKYHDRSRPLAWYYGHFPTPQSFLEHGGLVTGEASPGYLPYPAVARDAYKTWKGNLVSTGAGIGSKGKPLAQFLANPSYKSEVPEVPPRIIALGREPLDRIYSSYKYNYVVPTIEHLRTKGHPRIPAARPGKKGDDNENKFQLHREDDEYYLPYLFTLEDFVRAELEQLRGCLYDWGPERTYTKWSRDLAYKKALTDRNGKGTPATTEKNSTIPSQPLIDLDGICYGKDISKTVYREQWSEMQPMNPEKVLLNKNLHLTQSMIGRSLYVFPLDWWYLNFRPDPDDPDTANSITFVCTEDLNNVDTLNELTEKLGLPKHDGFDEILNEGAYNVGGHRGYDTATSWEEIEQEKETNGTISTKDGTNGKLDSTASSSDIPMTNGIPLPEDLYLELKEFINPINERLFALTGKRCNW
eukprot:CAMPEP_0116120786 /NCGR_PEP_ID=MMETSP0329-20121206/3357_1 /TAXON_ID=697910 /ORGANISM="Pseudo-nitzschia arenysensis, Strain B593" /LENGTH=675 /DNA_ID=CAMNT_0003614571 /DNA_START=80 /DNA_END=2104 /DNA_ORIENTATION=+